MKIADIRKKSDKDLQKMITETKDKIAQLHLDKRTKEVKDVNEVKKNRRLLARLLTEANARQQEDKTKEKK